VTRCLCLPALYSRHREFPLKPLCDALPSALTQINLAISHMGFADAVTFTLLTTGLIFAARPACDLVDRIITKSRGRREAGIHLPSDDDCPSKKPFPRCALIILAHLAVLGLLGQVFMIVTSIRVRYWHYGDELRIWWFIQIAYIVVHHALLLLALTYPTQLIIKSTWTFPPTKPLFTFKRSRLEHTNPGAIIQTLALVIFTLPFIADLEHYSWYNWFYYRNAHFNAATFSGITQQLIALAVFVYGTVVRQVYGGMDEGSDIEHAAGQTSTSNTPEPAALPAGPSA
jgi:hypothetical protein